MEIIFNLIQLPGMTSQFVEHIQEKRVVAFHGTMGAGKTTFIHAVCKALGVRENISSPTFSIIHEYQGLDSVIYHLDLYRLNSEQEAINAGVEECLYNGGLCFIEWPEKIPSLIPEDAMHVYIEAIDEQNRKVSFKLESGKSF